MNSPKIKWNNKESQYPVVGGVHTLYTIVFTVVQFLLGRLSGI